jgi:hypothetical protein
MAFKLLKCCIAYFVLSSGLNAAPMYYVFEGYLTTVSDAAGLATIQLSAGSAFSVVFLVDMELDGTKTYLSMYPFLNQQFTSPVYDNSYNGGLTVVDNFYADLLTGPLLNGSSWNDLNVIEYNYGTAINDNGVHYFNLTGSNSPNSTGAVTELTSSAQLTEDFLGTTFRYHETASIQDGASTLTSSVYGMATLVSVSDTYVPTVPIPASVMLFGSGLIGLWRFAIRKTSAPV